MKLNIIYITAGSFPEGGAAARRIYGNCVSMRNKGHNVEILSAQENLNMSSNYSYYKGIKIISLNERVHESKYKLLKHFLYLSIGNKTINYLNSLISRPDVIILYSGYSPYLIKLIPWCKKYNVKLVFDAVEWYDPPNKIAYLTPYYLNIELAMRRLIAKSNNVICISSYLCRYFKSKGCNTILIPPTLPLEYIEFITRKSLTNNINLVYAGSPGRKENLKVVIEAVQIINNMKQTRKFCLHLAGINNDFLLRIFTKGQISQLFNNNTIKVYGHLTYEDSLELVKKSDFSTVIRPSSRSNNAGFSTKIVESLSVGTPVITTLTSDISKYIHNEGNGFICKDTSKDEIVKTLLKISQLSDSKYSSLRFNARRTAESNFDALGYSKQIDDFLQNLL